MISYVYANISGTASSVDPIFGYFLNLLIMLYIKSATLTLYWDFSALIWN